jgi:DNA anti-recombination protein RmuC
MKTTVAILLLLISPLSTSIARADGKFVVVKVTDRASYESYTVLTPDGVKSLRDEIRKELRYHGKALSLSRKYWRNKENNRRTFPAAAIGKRSYSVVGSTYPNEASANEMATQLELRARTRQDLEKQKDKDRQKRRYKNSTRRRARTFSDKTREREKDHLSNRAREIYTEQLNLLMNPPAEVDEP